MSDVEGNCGQAQSQCGKQSKPHHVAYQVSHYQRATCKPVLIWFEALLVRSVLILQTVTRHIRHFPTDQSKSFRRNFFPFQLLSNNEVPNDQIRICLVYPNCTSHQTVLHYIKQQKLIALFIFNKCQHVFFLIKQPIPILSNTYSIFQQPSHGSAPYPPLQLSLVNIYGNPKICNYTSFLFL